MNGAVLRKLSGRALGTESPVISLAVISSEVFRLID